MAGKEDGSDPMSSKLVSRVEAERLKLLPAKALPSVKAGAVVPAKATVPVLATPPCKRQLSFATAGEPGSKQPKIPSQAWLHGVYMFFCLPVLSIADLPMLEATDTSLHRSMSERRV